MNTRAIATEYRLVQWGQAMQERIASGESIKEFCQGRGISRNTYFYWQRKLRELACRELLPVAKEEPGSTREYPAPKGWALCEVVEEVKAEGELTIEIGGCRVLANRDIDPELLLKVCWVLKSLC